MTFVVALCGAVALRAEPHETAQDVDTFTIRLLDTNEQRRSFDKASLRDFGLVDSSLMPSCLAELTEPEIADAVSYLVPLEGSNPS